MDSLIGLIIAIYARFSSDNQKDTSIDDQIRMCRQFIESHGGVVREDLIFVDYSVSGASIARDGFDRLSRLALGKARCVDVIVTETTDRLSRDLGDADRFYKQIEYAGVRLCCFADGIDSSQRGARMMFGMKALMADQYLEDLRGKTFRGLEGQAQRGYSTGGLPLGYISRPIWGENKREPIGFEILIDEEAAELVRRVFSMYRDGLSYLGITEQLNQEGVEPLRHMKKGRRRGWVSSTIREILRNEAYIGIWRFGVKQWRKLPGTNKRRSRRRPTEAVQVQHRPHLRILEDDLWQEVSTRLQSVALKYKGKSVGALAPGRRTSYPLSGLLVCALCGAPMVISGGSNGRYYKCGDAHKRANCTNKTSIREDLLTQAVIDHMVGVLRNGETVARLTEEAQSLVHEASRTAGDELLTLTKALSRIESETDKLVIAIKTLDASTSPGALRVLTDALDKASTEKRLLEANLDAVRTQSASGPRVPAAEDLVRLAQAMEHELRDDPIAFREVLRQMTDDGQIRLEPQPDGSYLAHAFFMPLVVPPRTTKTRKPRSGGTRASSSDTTEVVYSVGCAGRI